MVYRLEEKISIASTLAEVFHDTYRLFSASPEGLGLWNESVGVCRRTACPLKLGRIGRLLYSFREVLSCAE